MPKIKKREAAASPPKPERLPVVQQCHYTILRHPLRDAGKGTFHNGPEPANILAVHNGVVAMLDGQSAEKLFDNICFADHWFIKKSPGRYSVVATVWGLSFTFLVMQDGTYHKGWTRWPDFLKWEMARGVNIND